MSTRCRHCSGLSVQGLFSLAKQEFSGHEFPALAFYQHHSSFHHLEQSANTGCELCLLIIDCFKGIQWTEGDYQFSPYLWETEADLDIESSAYAAAKQLAVSDVKLSLGTDHVYLGDALEKVRSFNTLLVQVGPRELPDESDDIPFPFLTLALNNRDCATEIDGIKIGRLKVDPDLSSPSQFKIARGWLDQCRTSHQDCLTDNIPKLPTRVVDIGTSGTVFVPRVFISQGAKGNYIALSHCWGGRITSVLTTNTYQDYQKALPISEIPANFKDAFRIAKELGIQYVWIDSLCIIQDSKEDWEIESSKMGGVYRNATLTVSALVSANSAVGVLKNNKNLYPSAPKTARLQIYEDKSKDREVEVEWKSQDEENLRRLMIDCALTSRGWTLQEYILSPRNLLYGGRQIYWHCPSLMISADNTPEGNQFPEQKLQNASRVIYSDILAKPPHVESDIKAVLEDYYELVETYSARQLTYGSDKFAAFSGIAQMMHPTIGGQYFAGIWTADFKQGLLWYAEMGSCRHIESHGAPSWSWMVTDAPVLFSKMRIFDTTPYDVKLSGFDGISQDLAKGFCQTQPVSVIVEGLAMPLIRNEQNVRASETNKLIFGSVYYDEPSPSGNRVIDSIFKLYDNVLGEILVSMSADPGNEDIDIDSTLFLEDNLLVLLVQADDKTDNERIPSFGEGIVLRPLKDGLEDTYERIGYVTFWLPSMKFFQGWGLKSLKIK